MMRFEIPKNFESLLTDRIITDFIPRSRPIPAMDITEYESEYVVVGEMPGVKKEDVKITFEKNVLTVEGKRKPHETPEEAKILLNEVRVREFNRSIRVPDEIDADGISAELENGVLRIALPKAKNAQPRTISIK